MIAWGLPLVAGLLLSVQATSQLPAQSPNSTQRNQKPNIILIITDDQDVRTGTLEYMPKTRRTLGEQGITFERFYAPVSLCCPSRVSLLRAQYAHNHNITYVSGDFGGYHLFCEKGHNNAYLPVFLQGAGYNTYYTGKLMNGLSYSQLSTQYPQGWTYSDFLVDPNAYLYYNASFSVNNTGNGPVVYEGQYQVDIIQEKALGLLQAALRDNSKPFFLGIAPTAPHMEVQFNGTFTEPLPRAGEESLFEGVRVPRVPSFNVKGEGAVSWLKDKKKLDELLIDYIDHVYRQRLRVLQPVDDLVEAIVQKVEDAGPEVAQNTYIIYTADNGYALGSHRRNLGKTLPYEEDVLVPLLIRGPGVPRNATNSKDIYSMPDLGATILGLAGADVNQYSMDGTAFLGDNSPSVIENVADGPTNVEVGLGLNIRTEKKRAKPRHTLVEYWNGALEEGIYANQGLRPNTTYRSIRVADESQDGGETYDWVYGVWCTGERELYNLQADPYQLLNLASNNIDPTSFQFASPDYSRLASRLDALLVVLKTCVGDTCRNPWGAIFPAGEANGLIESLDARYDTYFDSLPKFGYRLCQFGYFEEDAAGQVESPRWNEEMAYGAS
ncbi:arylsulfatase [Moniliophthora roreri]|uniref:Putative arylsulfatase n=1 Tax=Moniliophthora roreri TaxID=221103 RepID=A0A0W0FVH9_MONRR|nr:arylsulfatase [Moniliophthora roreri]